jgi:hypothetical protein
MIGSSVILRRKSLSARPGTKTAWNDIPLVDKRSEHRPVFFFHAFSLILTFLRAVADPATLKSWEKYSNRLEADGSPAKPHLAIRLGQRRLIHMSSASPCTARRTLQLPDLLC